MVDAPWWLSEDRADWRHHEGPSYTSSERPVVHEGGEETHGGGVRDGLQALPLGEEVDAGEQVLFIHH